MSNQIKIISNPKLKFLHYIIKLVHEYFRCTYVFRFVGQVGRLSNPDLIVNYNWDSMCGGEFLRWVSMELCEMSGPP